jgi:hypothetical protein
MRHGYASILDPSCIFAEKSHAVSHDLERAISLASIVSGDTLRAVANGAENETQLLAALRWIVGAAEDAASEKFYAEYQAKQLAEKETKTDGDS